MSDNLVSIDEFMGKRLHSKGGAVAKSFSAPTSWNSQARSARFVMSSDSVDHEKDIIRQEGIDLSNFSANPQALLFHNSRDYPIGKWSDVSKNLTGAIKTTEGTLNFLPEGADPESDRAAKHVAFGTLRTVSIGFIPTMLQRREGPPQSYNNGYNILECKMLECSLVPVPAQPDAIVKSAGDDMVLARQLIEEILDTYAKTPDGLLVPRAEYERVYRAKRIESKKRRIEEPEPEPEAKPAPKTMGGKILGMVVELFKAGAPPTPVALAQAIAEIDAALPEPVAEPDPKPVPVPAPAAADVAAAVAAAKAALARKAA